VLSFATSPTDQLPNAATPFYGTCYNFAPYTAGSGETALYNFDASYRPPPATPVYPLMLQAYVFADNGVSPATGPIDAFASQDTLGAAGGHVSVSGLMNLTAGTQYQFGASLWAQGPAGPLGNSGASCHGTVVILKP
jgi:hypothetical protein